MTFKIKIIPPKHLDNIRNGHHGDGDVENVGKPTMGKLNCYCPESAATRLLPYGRAPCFPRCSIK